MKTLDFSSIISTLEDAEPEYLKLICTFCDVNLPGAVQRMAYESGIDLAYDLMEQLVRLDDQLQPIPTQ